MSIIVNKIPVKINDKFMVTKNGESNGYGFAKEIVTVLHIYDSSTIGIVSEKSHPNWGDLDGRVEPGHGFYVNPLVLRDNFDRIGIKYSIPSTYKYNDTELKGKSCNVLYVTSDRETSFVEFEEDIGGGGCDGLGKHGHCIAVPSHILHIAMTQLKQADETIPQTKRSKAANDDDF